MRAEIPAIAVSALVKNYRAVIAVAGVDFSVARGEIVGLPAATAPARQPPSR
jgi:ABC-type multidrug transport system ATPase subunit